MTERIRSRLGPRKPRAPIHSRSEPRKPLVRTRWQSEPRKLPARTRWQSEPRKLLARIPWQSRLRTLTRVLALAREQNPLALGRQATLYRSVQPSVAVRTFFSFKLTKLTA